MKICLFAEGSYPHIQGGVSSWINNLIKACPEHEFIIYAIGADSSKRGDYKYVLPDNVESVIEVFLDDLVLSNKKKGARYRLSDIQKEAITNLIFGENIQWNNVFDLFSKKPFSVASEFFMSKDFFDIIRDLYEKEYPYTPFTEFIWSMRSMYLTLFFLLLNDMPKADIYHSVSTGYAGVIASYSKHLYDKPLILSEHGIYTREREEEIIKAGWVKSYYKDIWIKYFYNFSKCAYERADIVTSLFSVNRELQVELGCPEEKIRIIPNGVHMNRYVDLPQKENHLVVNVGAIVRVVPIKDIKTMLQAFKIVHDSNPNTVFHIMGPVEEDEEYYNECLEMKKYLELERVHFTGMINIMDYIGKMDVLVLTSISEGQPLAVMEGMAANKPHVTTNVGDCHGLLYGVDDHYGQAGYVEYVMDSEGIARSIAKLVNDENLRREMGQNGFNRVSNKYRFEDYIKEYKDMYQSFK